MGLDGRVEPAQPSETSRPMPIVGRGLSKQPPFSEPGFDAVGSDEYVGPEIQRASDLVLYEQRSQGIDVGHVVDRQTGMLEDGHGLPVVPGKRMGPAQMDLAPVNE